MMHTPNPTLRVGFGVESLVALASSGGIRVYYDHLNNIQLDPAHRRTPLMDSASSEHKRKRLCSSASNTSANDPTAIEANVAIKRHPDFWFDDGSIILLASSTDAFRVHRTVLARCSEIFRDMLLVGDPGPGAESEGMIEGCPVVRLPDDVADICRLLKAIYDPLIFARDKEMTFRERLCYLRVASKYMVTAIREEVITYLRSLYPSTLEEYHAAPTFSEHSSCNVLLAVNTGITCHILDILPTAFYICCLLLPRSVLLEGEKDADGNTIHLETSSLLKCLTGMADLLESRHTFIDTDLCDLANANVCGKGNCHLAFLELVNSIHEHKYNDINIFDADGVFDGTGGIDISANGRAPANAPPEPSTDVGPIKRHSEFWFDDGSIVLLAGGTEAFRVHRTILAAHSEVFRDMLLVGDPEAADQEMVEGCPVVHLPDATDIRRLLTAIYNPLSFTQDKEMTLQLGERLCYMRVASKYMISTVREDVIAHLRSLYPSTFKDFVATLATPHTPDLWYNAFSAVQAGIKYDIPDILPAAYYACCLCPVSILVDGVRDKHGNYMCLESSSLIACFAGRSSILALRSIYLDAVFCSMANGEGDCDDEDCRLCILDLIATILSSHLLDIDIFQDPGAFAGILHFSGLCNLCTAAWEETVDTAKLVIWMRLPECFGLAVSWSKLLNKGQALEA
ncbi:hypothetical protein EVG20_g4798 [Dentipellis fragilis]|uniref:BTB domain-containing protein n=1 Tax=Dentipellis fragilis TaxID=205917 RepID=A0A4Y9YX10_9AGAM|nr:hypothetical protein EVG20_g4798 [Dentipellis fragilis]